FPLQKLRSLGFDHIELKGQKAYHGVATLSRIPIERVESRDFNGTGEARHLAVRLSADEAKGAVVHNFYVPAGGDIPDAKKNPKFGLKLKYLAAMERWCAQQRNKAANRAILVGDLNVAPLESDVWSHKQLLRVVSHTPVKWITWMPCAMPMTGWMSCANTYRPKRSCLPGGVTGRVTGEARTGAAG
ncbi:MAG: hypothetical protein ACTSP0_06145, partial [Alphaproteobacteria bacterium]